MERRDLFVRRVKGSFVVVFDDCVSASVRRAWVRAGIPFANYFPDRGVISRLARVSAVSRKVTGSVVIACFVVTVDFVSCIKIAYFAVTRAWFAVERCVSREDRRLFFHGPPSNDG